MNQLVAEDHKDLVTSTNSYSKVYVYDTKGNRSDVSQFPYEGRSNVSIPYSYYTNNGFIEVMPYYNGNSSGSIYYTDVGLSVPSFSFVYYDTEYWFELPATTTLLSTNFDSLRKGYYESVYRAVNSQYGIDVTFNIRIGVGHLSTMTPISRTFYHYNSTWLDQLESYDILGVNHAMTYDNQGNPTTITNFAYKGVNYHHANLSWDGRELRKIEVYNTSNNLVESIYYRYNDQGYRTSKTFKDEIGTIKQEIEYTLSGDKVLYETDGTYGITYTYDFDGTIISFEYDDNINDLLEGIDYFYFRNQQGDITTIVDQSGSTIVKYRYDAYGIITNIVDNSSGDIISKMNPYTYRGYRYDTEVGYYYLNSRYYNPEIGRFINADGMLGEAGDILSTNMYAYCGNNPVMNVDPSGYDFLGISTKDWINIGKIVGTVAIIGGLIALTIVTGGLAAAAAGGAALTGWAAFGAAVAPIVSGALWGAGFGAGFGALVGGLTGGAQGALDGMWNGAWQGAITGTISGSLCMIQFDMKVYHAGKFIFNALTQPILQGTASMVGSILKGDSYEQTMTAFGFGVIGGYIGVKVNNAQASLLREGIIQFGLQTGEYWVNWIN